MRLIPQGPSECKLATLAMLADVSLEAVREVACRAAGVRHWYQVWDQRDRIVAFHRGVEAVAEHFGITRYASLNGVLSERSSVITTFTPELLAGQGELILRFGFDTHSVAYEHRVIYDPLLPAPLPWDEWLAHYPHAVDFIVAGETKEAKHDEIP